MRTVAARIPSGFAAFCRFIFYFDIIGLVLFAGLGGRAFLVPMLPLYLIAMPALWYYAHWIRMANRQIPTYEVDPEGVRDRAGYVGNGVLTTWDEIAEVRPYNFFGFRGLKARLRNRNAFLSRLTYLEQVQAWLGILCYGSPLVIWAAWSDVSLEDLEDAVTANWEIAQAEREAEMTAILTADDAPASLALRLAEPATAPTAAADIATQTQEPERAVLRQGP